MKHDKAHILQSQESTYRSRVKMGFKGKNSWRDAIALYDEHTLTINGHPVMEDWEESYMLALAEIAAHQGGSILEIGFGMGISARYIQEHPIDQHVIIEANKEVYAQLEIFALTAKRQTIPLFGFWEDIVSQIPSGSIAGILFDTYPLREEEVHRNHFFFFKEAYRLLVPGGILTYYSDEARDFSKRHMQALNSAGFSDIDKIICPVLPPRGCKYWKKNTLLAPVVRK